jgi:protein transport protein SEC13
MDYYGKRVASCSTDKTIKIFEVATADSAADSDLAGPTSASSQNQVKLLATLVGHEAPVWQIQWAHPKFGSILASCSYDRNVIIWKEQEAGATTGNKSGGASGGSALLSAAPSASTSNASNSAGNWVKIYQHSVHELSVNSICWASHEYGLHLACGSSDGTISVLTYHGAGYSSDTVASDNSAGWSVDRFAAHPSGVNAVSWAPFMPSSASSSSSSSLLSSAPSTQAMSQQGQNEPLTMRLATGGCDHVVHIWSRVVNAPSATGGIARASWQREATLEGHKDWIRDVAWAPSIGLPSSLIATASQDGTVRVWSRDGPNKRWESQVIDMGGEPVWRVSWSLTGNILAVTSGDSKVSLFKQSLDKSSWMSISQLDSA